MFSGINKNNFSFFGFSNLSFFVFVFTTWKKKIFIFKYFLHWFNAVRSQSTLISQEVFCDYQINFFFGGGGGRGWYSMFLARGENLIWGTWNFVGGFNNHLYIWYPYKFMGGYLYFLNNLKYTKDHIYADMKYAVANFSQL